jgi:hypothetical protein
MPVISSAIASYRELPTSTVTSGLARRLCSQAGGCGRPALLAKTISRAASSAYAMVTVRGSPDRAPVVVS